MDLLDNILGPLNYFDRLEGLFKGLWYRDFGYQIAVLYADRGGHHSRQAIEALLRRYGIAVYGRTHDADHMYFHVKRRQARWAEYILLHAGVVITSPPFDERNLEYPSRHPPGWLPTPWSEQEDKETGSAPRPSARAKPTQPASFWQKLDQMLDEWLK